MPVATEPHSVRRARRWTGYETGIEPFQLNPARIKSIKKTEGLSRETFDDLTPDFKKAVAQQVLWGQGFKRPEIDGMLSGELTPESEAIRRTRTDLGTRWRLEREGGKVRLRQGEDGRVIIR
jgi:hypothetical protein